MSWKGYISFFSLFLASSASLLAQDMQFSQAYSNPVHLNPAYAGTNEFNRLTLNYRNQWTALPHPFISFSAGSDHYLSSLNSGIGVSFHRDVAGASALSNTLVGVSYSQQVRLSRKATLAIGIRGALGQRAFDSGRLLFADQVIRESSVSLSQPFIAPSHQYGTASAGLLFYRKKCWLGVVAHNLNEPNQSLMAGNSVIPMSFSVHGGGEIPVRAFEDDLGARKLRIAFNYKSQGEWDQLDLGGFFTLYGFNVGMWYRGLPLKEYKPGYSNHEAVVLMLGYEAPRRWSVGYSYDITVSRLAGLSGGAHEVALVYEYRTKKPNNRRRVIPCAKF